MKAQRLIPLLFRLGAIHRGRPAKEEFLDPPPPFSCIVPIQVPPHPPTDVHLFHTKIYLSQNMSKLAEQMYSFYKNQ